MGHAAGVVAALASRAPGVPVQDVEASAVSAMLAAGAPPPANHPLAVSVPTNDYLCADGQILSLKQ